MKTKHTLASKFRYSEALVRLDAEGAELIARSCDNTWHDDGDSSVIVDVEDSDVIVGISNERGPLVSCWEYPHLSHIQLKAAMMAAVIRPERPVTFKEAQASLEEEAAREAAEREERWEAEESAREMERWEDEKLLELAKLSKGYKGTRLSKFLIRKGKGHLVPFIKDMARAMSLYNWEHQY